MNRRRFTGKTADHMAGRLAWFDGDCARCPDAIVAGVSQIVQRRNGWIHTKCASGGDDE